MKKINLFLLLIYTSLCICYAEEAVSPFKERAKVNATVGVSPVHRKSLAEQTLEGIVEEQNTLIRELSQNLSAYPENERDRRIDNILRRYETFLSDNPDSVNGYILYGKFLYAVGLLEDANKAFLMANKKDPNIPVVKQQIGNYLAEKGDFALAYAYFSNAIDLSPNTAIYHFQLGELLHVYKESFIREKIFTPEQLDNLMQESFLKATNLDPNQWAYQMRYGESFYDIDNPNWEKALRLWDNLEAKAGNRRDLEIIYLHQARIQIKLRNYAGAKQKLSKVFMPELEKSRRELLAQIS